MVTRMQLSCIESSPMLPPLLPSMHTCVGFIGLRHCARVLSATNITQGVMLYYHESMYRGIAGKYQPAQDCSNIWRSCQIQI